MQNYCFFLKRARKKRKKCKKNAFLSKKSSKTASALVNLVLVNDETLVEELGGEIEEHVDGQDEIRIP